MSIRSTESVTTRPGRSPSRSMRDIVPASVAVLSQRRPTFFYRLLLIPASFVLIWWLITPTSLRL